jgi:hypothetical protein
VKRTAINFSVGKNRATVGGSVMLMQVFLELHMEWPMLGVCVMLVGRLLLQALIAATSMLQ